MRKNGIAMSIAIILCLVLPHSPLPSLMKAWIKLTPKSFKFTATLLKIILRYKQTIPKDNVCLLIRLNP